MLILSLFQKSVQENEEDSDSERLDSKQIDMAQDQWLSDTTPQGL